MTGWIPIFAADVIPQPTRVPRLLASDLVLIIFLAVLVFGLFIAWIVLIRGSKSLQLPSRRVHRDSESTDDETEDEPAGGRKRKRKRVRRKEHRQRNPTLSQTGGLPPPREATTESSTPPG